MDALVVETPTHDPQLNPAAARAWLQILMQDNGDDQEDGDST